MQPYKHLTHTKMHCNVLQPAQGCSDQEICYPRPTVNSERPDKSCKYKSDGVYYIIAVRRKTACYRAMAVAQTVICQPSILLLTLRHLQVSHLNQYSSTTSVT